MDRVRRIWDQREAAPIEASLCFKSFGLVLGADTVLAPADQHGAIVVEGREAELLTLLSVAYGEPMGEAALGHIRRAAFRWNEGEVALADVHLALTRLPRLKAPLAASRRLIAAEELLREGLAPDSLLKALGMTGAAVETILKYSADQPRVPAGSGRTSGQWTDDPNGQQSAAALNTPPASQPISTRPSEVEPGSSSDVAPNERPEARFHTGSPERGSNDVVNPSTIEPVVDRALYHDTVVLWLAQVLRSTGSTVEVNFPLTLIGGDPTAYPDLIVLPHGSLVPYLIEVKTGHDPMLSQEQRIIYPATLLGEHLYSYSPRISLFGFAPGEPLPPMMVWAVHVSKPGAEIKAAWLGLDGEWHHAKSAGPMAPITGDRPWPSPLRI